MTSSPSTVLPYLSIQLGIVGSATFLAVTEIIDEMAGSAQKVGTLGMQGLLAFMLLALGFVIWYMEKKRTADRVARDNEVKEQYKVLLDHHKEFIAKADIERTFYHEESGKQAQKTIDLTERSILAMHAMATSTDALREYLKDRTATALAREEQRLDYHEPRNK